ncbi:unnamed protein product [Gadus morhua 'NCC']
MAVGYQQSRVLLAAGLEGVVVGAAKQCEASSNNPPSILIHKHHLGLMWDKLQSVCVRSAGTGGPLRRAGYEAQEPKGDERQGGARSSEEGRREEEEESKVPRRSAETQTQRVRWVNMTAQEEENLGLHPSAQPWPTTHMEQTIPEAGGVPGRGRPAPPTPSP